MNCKAEIIGISRSAIELSIGDGEIFHLDFKRYPWFEYCTINEISNVLCDGFGVSWPDAAIDLELDLLRHPEKQQTITSLTAWLNVREKLQARKGLSTHTRSAGKVKSAAKAASSRLNGQKGGRPRKSVPAVH